MLHFQTRLRFVVFGEGFFLYFLILSLVCVDLERTSGASFLSHPLRITMRLVVPKSSAV